MSTLAAAHSNRLRFHMPGHKGKPLPYTLDIGADLTELAGTDDLFEPTGAIAAAQRAAAKSAHAGHTIMLTNGSTSGIITMMMYAVSPGGNVIMSRSAHHSAMSACVLGGLIPIYVRERRSADGLLIPDDALWIAAIRENPDASAVFVTSPTYDGIVLPLERIVEEARRAGMRLLVDQAHGAHWNWWESPADAGRCGASLWVQSAHKTLPVPGQCAWLHMAPGENPDLTRSILRLTHTSSPSFFFMNALDNVGLLMYNVGSELLTRLVDMIPREWPTGLCDPRDGRGWQYDPTRIVLDVTGRGITGYEASRQLAAGGVDIEAADDRRIIMIATVADEPEDFVRLKAALEGLQPGAPNNTASPSMPCLIPDAALSPRDAALADRTQIPLTEASGRVAAEAFGAYPPGVPAVMPGEVIPGEVVEWMRRMVALGAGTFGIRDGGVAVVRE